MVHALAEQTMKCNQCDAELIHGGSHDAEDYGVHDCSIVNNYSCPQCQVLVIEYVPGEEPDDD